MNEDQIKVVEDYIEKYGGVEVLEYNGIVQLKLHSDMVKMEGVSFGWVERFKEHFEDGNLGVSPAGEVYINLHLIPKD